MAKVDLANHDDDAGDDGFLAKYLVMIIPSYHTRPSYLASLLDVELLVGDKEDAVANVEDEDCRLKTKA